MIDPPGLLRRLMATGLKAADPMAAVLAHLPKPPKGRTVVLAAGKAAASMAKAVEDAWPADLPLEGLAVARYGYGLPLLRIDCTLASHPVPDQAGLLAADRMLSLAAGLTPDDLVLALISGGGSALLVKPASGLSIEDKRRVTMALLASGADIKAINTVRKHLSAIKGGRLALAAHPARLVTLAVSDVAGDDPSVIASAPTLGDPTSIEDARRVLQAYGIPEPPVWSESPKPDDPRLAGGDYRLILKPADMLEAVEAEAKRLGLSTVNLGDRVTGEASDVALRHATLARSVGPGTLILSGGELTVTIRGAGRGGPNCEYLLALALALKDRGDIHALAVDTDGIDGNQDCAGGVIAPGIVLEGERRGLDGEACLRANDSHAFLAATGGLVVTGPTRTNLNDLRLLLVL